MTTTNPIFIPRAWASDGGVADTIPDAPPVTPGRASWQEGFPPETMQPEIAGGVPPFGEDANGVLLALSEHAVYLQSGNLFGFSADFISGGGSYNRGALVRGNDGATIYMAIVDGVTDDPNDPSAGTNWNALYNTNYATIPVGAGGVVTLTLQQVASRVLIFTGAPTASVQAIIPRHQLRQWLIVNQMTGGQTLTVKTLAGTGASVSAGGSNAPTPVYSEGANVYLATAPLGLAIDQAATPLTLAQRTAAGALVATLFQSTAAVANFTYANVFVDNGDGFARKISNVNFSSQLAIAQLAGQVSNGQVPLSAVAQYTAAILASAALTGAPSAPTQPVGTSNGLIATTAFANPAQNIASNGSVTLPGGVILKWGFSSGAAGAGATAVTFDTPFPNNCLSATCSTGNRNSMGSNGYSFVDALTTVGFTAWFDVQQVGGGAGTRGGYWWAVGN